MSVLSEISQPLWEFIEQQLDEAGMTQALEAFAAGETGPKRQLDADELHDIFHEPLFMEWLWFEYRLPRLKATVLKAFARQAHALSPGARHRLDQLLSTNRYAIWRIGEVIPGNMEFIDLKRGARYRVREFSLAKQTRPGDCMFVRLAQQDDHWEIVSANTVAINFPEETDALDFASDFDEPVSIKQSLGYISYLSHMPLQMAPNRPRQASQRLLKHGKVWTIYSKTPVLRPTSTAPASSSSSKTSSPPTRCPPAWLSPPASSSGWLMPPTPITTITWTAL
jgi:hypothetical protein